MFLQLTRLIRPTLRCTNLPRRTTALFKTRQFHDEFNQKPPPPPNSTEVVAKLVPTAVAARYQVFKDEDATVILDVDEERQRLSGVGDSGEEDQESDSLPDIYAGLNMEREL